MHKKISFLIIIVLAVALLAGCRSTPQTLPADDQGGPAVDLPANAGNDADAPEDQCDLVEYGVSGEILSITVSEDADILGSIEVKGELDNGAVYDYAMVTITPDTKIYRNDAIGFDDLETGMYVNVFFDGAVAESYPVQGTASQVNVVENEEPAEE